MRSLGFLLSAAAVTAIQRAGTTYGVPDWLAGILMLLGLIFLIGIIPLVVVFMATFECRRRPPAERPE